MLTDIAKKLRAALLSATVLMACVGQAQAASYVGSWDPAFGNPFDIPGTSLGWKGTVKFNVPDACLAAPNRDELHKNVPDDPSNCAYQDQLFLEWGVVQLYEMSAPNVILGTVNFGPTVFDNNDSIYVDANGKVTQLTADFDVWKKSDPAVSFVGDNAEYFLSFTGFCAELQIRGFPVSDNNNQNTSGNATSNRCDPQSKTGPFLFFTNLSAETVPEPGSLALLLPAVGMLAAFRRRKSASAAA